MTAALSTETLQLGLAVGLGLLGFVEPCTMGANLVLLKYLEARPRRDRLFQIVLYAATRGLFMGGLGVLAAGLGQAFFEWQRAMWIVLGLAYLTIGAIYLGGRRKWLSWPMPAVLRHDSANLGSVLLGVLFGLNVPACAGPLIFALLGMVAARSTGRATGANDQVLWQGFVSLLVFGLALSLPLVLAVLWYRARNAMDWLAGLSARMPKLTGLVLIVLGLWSVGFGVLAHPHPM